MGFVINTVTLSGNLTRDPELRSTASGTSVCSLSLAVNERFKTRDGDWSDRANYFDVTVWGGQGEWLSKNLSKGDGIVVEGRLRWRSWEKDGQKRSAVDVIAESVVPVPRASNGGSRSDERRETASVAADHGEFDRPLPGGDDIPF